MAIVVIGPDLGLSAGADLVVLLELVVPKEAKGVEVESIRFTTSRKGSGRHVSLMLSTHFSALSLGVDALLIQHLTNEGRIG